MPNCQLLTIHLCLFCLDGFIVDVIVVGHQFVDSALWCQFDDTVGNGVDELMVVGREDDIALELYQVVVERLNGFKVKVVRWRVEDQAVGVLQLPIARASPRGSSRSGRTPCYRVGDRQW